MEKLTNKNILIVGATGGIGRKLAELLVQSGANVFLSGRNTNTLQALGSELQLLPADYSLLICLMPYQFILWVSKSMNRSARLISS